MKLIAGKYKIGDVVQTLEGSGFVVRGGSGAEVVVKVHGRKTAQGFSASGPSPEVWG